MTQAIGTGELIPLSKQSAHRRHHSLINQAVCCHYFLPSLSPARGASSSCPRFNLASDCARAPVPTSWFLPHADLHLAIEHSQSQELDWELTAGQCHCCTIFVLIPATPEDISFPATTASFNNTNYCVVVLKCLALSTTLILANWTELNWGACTSVVCSMTTFSPSLTGPFSRDYSRLDWISQRRTFGITVLRSRSEP